MPSIQEPPPPLDGPPKEVTLRSIAGWQLDKEQQPGFAVELPKLQRGFVWEPEKVMDLWDSLLRGYPIGSMMITSVNAESANSGVARYWLLDGQQRATSIAIGQYNPWAPQQAGPSMWSLKSIPLLWLDLMPEPREWDVKMFFSFLITQSHPWGYNRDGGVIPWKKRGQASDAFGLGNNYTGADLSRCFPWEAAFPVPLAILLEVANREGVNDEGIFWSELGKSLGGLPESWKDRFGCRLNEAAPESLATVFKGLRRIPTLRVHLNLLSHDAAENDANTDDDNSLLFVRLNAGGVVLGGEELIFSLFKSAFGEAKDAVEKCSAGFMAPSKLFGLLVRLAASKQEPARLARPVTLRDFKKEIRASASPLKAALEAQIHKEHEQAECEAAGLMKWAHDILCGPKDAIPDFCLPQAVATRTINESPDIFLALLYWRRKGGDVEINSEEHRRLLGRFTALSWFLPGNARAKQQALAEWLANADGNVAERLWSGECLRFLFTRKELAIPAFPLPDQLTSLLFCDGPDKVRHSLHYNYESLSGTAHDEFWKPYAFLPAAEGETPEMRPQHFEGNFKSFLGRLWPNRKMLLYAQRDYLRKRFQAFGQWELTLKDTNCPWDWDHIYPSASGLHNVDEIYRDWHDTIGNLRAEGLSENRGDGCNVPTEKLMVEDASGTPAWENSFIMEDIWKEMQSLGYRHNAIKNPDLAAKICAIVLKRMVSIYEEWHKELKIADLMKDIRAAEEQYTAAPNSDTAIQPRAQRP